MTAKHVNIALVGNPSSGVTTLFNQMTGGVPHMEDFGDTKVQVKQGTAKNHKSVNVIELPGMYSLSPYTVDDLENRKVLLEGKPDVIINVVDATNFERNMYLTLELMELDIPMVLALNMMDEVEKNNIEIDINRLSEILTIPVLPIAASKNRGIHDLIHYAIDTSEKHLTPAKIDFCCGHIHTAIHSISHIIEDPAGEAGLPLRFSTTKVVEGDSQLMEQLHIHEKDLAIIESIIKDMEFHLETDREAAMADMRYEYIGAVCGKTVKRSTQTSKEYRLSVKLDKILTHKIFAIPIFLSIMALVFYLTFGSLGIWLSKILSAGIDWWVSKLGNLLVNSGAGDALYSLVIDGVCAGIGSVLSFLPVIGVLFLCLSILEDSGYMPRVAFVMDKLLRKLGLSGRSIVPMLIGFGCSVPAIMSTRDLPSKRDRHMTITLIPFMSCSAKLPLYGMITTAFFAKKAALVMIGIYATGILMAILVALIFNRTVFKGEPVPFLMVLPPYRVPAVKSVMIRVWENVKDFIKKAFTVIFAAAIVIWFLQSFNGHLELVHSPEDSILASIGKSAAPFFAPLGFGDWRAATSLITGLSAKEAVVSTLAVLTGAVEGQTLQVMLSQMFTPLSAFSFLIFCLLYVPCIASLVTIKKEKGGWKYVFATIAFQIGIAWVTAFVVYNVGGLICSFI